MDKLPYATMRKLQQLAGENRSTNFIYIGDRPPPPEAMNRRYGFLPPLPPNFSPYVEPGAPTSKFESSASLQDLVDFGLIKHGYRFDGERQTKDYGFHLTEKAVELLRAEDAK